MNLLARIRTLARVRPLPPDRELPEVAETVAIIMDGNGRWAQLRGEKREAGHKAGSAAVRRIVRVCRRLGLDALTLYAFSEQNWSRPAGEVGSDEEHRAEVKVQEMTDEHTKRIDDLLKHKEAEILEV